ncbi:MAG: CHAD domain-containing protein [Gammaproteobacteria bacterium]|nr:CHAD domain-containing protein [Gammaproteobacteria bacterium]
MSKKIKSPVPLTPAMSASEAAAAIFKHHFKYMERWEKTARGFDDIEGVHQLRVSFRKIRSAFSLFRDAIPKAVSQPWNQEIRWIASQLGLARDLDVFIAEGMGAIEGKLPFNGEKKLLELARAARAEAYASEVRPMLDSDRFANLKKGFEEWYEQRSWEQESDDNKALKRQQMRIIQYSRKLLDKQERRVLTLGSHIDRRDAQQMHRLRIECKKLRYAADFFRPLYSGFGGFMEHMAGLQDILGVMNDIAVTHHLLELLLANNSDHETLEYAGAIVGWRTCDYYHQLQNFDRYWDEFTEATHPWWKKGAHD